MNKTLSIIGFIILFIGIFRSFVEFFFISPYPENIYLTTILTGIAFIYLSIKLNPLI